MITLKTNTTSEVEQIILGLQELDSNSEYGSQLVRTVALSVLAEMRFRIQNNQQATDGSIIGQYSTKPLYVNVRESPASSELGRPLGKPVKGKRKSKFKSGMDHKTRYFPGGYREYKSKIFSGLKGVNLTLTGTMMNSMTVLKTDEGWGIGWNNIEYADRARMFEGQKYRKRIFGASLNERKIAIRTAKRFVANALSKRTS